MVFIKIRSILLALMILWDASLHWVELLGKVSIHPLYPYFPLFGLVSYDIFWTAYWTIAFLIMLTLLGSGNVNKTKIENHIHTDVAEVERLKKRVKELEDEKKTKV